MKIKQKALDKYAWFLRCAREDEPRPLEKIPFTEGARPAIEAFHVLESTGKTVATSEPELLERYIKGKEWHGVTVANVAEDFAISRLAFSAEIKANYPAWVANEIFAAAERIAEKAFGYVPTFARNRRDFSEDAA